jgi:hypothetical protein
MFSVLGPQGSIVEDSLMEAFYVGMPVYLPDEFGSCEVEGNQIAIAWLVPISRNEAACVARYGWDSFEDRLMELDSDLTNIFSRSIFSLNPRVMPSRGSAGFGKTGLRKSLKNLTCGEPAEL